MAFAGLATEVLPRTPFEQDANLRRRLREVVEEQHGLWIMGGALAATMAVTALILTVLSLATPVHPRSLAGILHTSGSLGSNANPIWGDVPFAAEVGESGRLLCTPILSSDVATFLRGAGRDELMKRVGQRGHLAKPAHATKLLFCLEDR